jgi:hypothetical protein
MYITNPIFGFLSILAACIPVICVIIIIYSKLYSYEPFSILLLLCCIYTIVNILSFAFTKMPVEIKVITSIGNMTEYCLLLFLLRSTSSVKWMTDLCIAALIIYLTLSVSYNFIKGFPEINAPVYAIGRGILLIIGGLFMIQLLRQRFILILYSSLFWVLAGACFFSSIYLLLQGMLYLTPVNGDQNTRDFHLLMEVLKIIEYSLFMIAPIVYQIGKPFDGVENRQ